MLFSFESLFHISHYESNRGSENKLNSQAAGNNVCFTKLNT